MDNVDKEHKQYVVFSRHSAATGSFLPSVMLDTAFSVQVSYNIKAFEI
jgi:hypothetical protein